MDDSSGGEINKAALAAKEAAMKALHETIIIGDRDLLHNVLDDNPHLMAERFTNGLTPLMLVLLQCGSVEDVLSHFLTLGADPCEACKASSLQLHDYNRSHIFGNGIEDRNPDNLSPMFPLDVALGMQQLSNVKLLLRHGACPRDHCTAGISKLAIFAVEQESVELLRSILEYDQQSCLEEEFLQRLSLMQPMNLAVNRGLVPIVELLLDFGADPNTEFCGTLPILLAAERGDTVMCRLLMERGAWLQAPSQPPVLGRALLGNRQQAIRNLIQLGCDVNGKASVDFLSARCTLQGTESPMVHLAVCKHNLTALRLLVEAGARLDETDGDNNTILHIACYSVGMRFKVFKSLLEVLSSILNWHQTILNAQNKMGLTPLMLMVQKGNSEAASALLDLEADSGLHAAPKLECKTALHFAVESGKEACLLALLRKGCGVNRRCSNHRTPLHVAVQLTNVNFAEILLSHGADLFAQTEQRECCLHLAVTVQCLEMVKLMVSQGLSVNLATRTGETALMMAATKDDTDICQYVIEQGALLNVRDRNRATALLLSIYFGQEHNAQILIAEGADMNTGDIKQTTPIYWCFFNNRIRTLQLLIIAGVRFTSGHLSFYPKNISAMRNKRLTEWLEQRQHNPCSLRQLARRSARAWMVKKADGKCIRRLLPFILLPHRLKGYLMFENPEWEDYLDDEES